MRPSRVVPVDESTVAAQAVRKLQAAGEVGEKVSGAALLADGTEAFAARLSVLHMAQKSIDVQYYLYHQDPTGMIFSGLLWQAAERGVRVRLLLDDNEKRPGDYPLNVLDAHPNIEVRLYNPYYRRGGRWWQLLTGFWRLNHRMHNKSITVDNRLAIVGGRNIGDEYFAVDRRVNFNDLDVLAAGPVAEEVSAQFDAYWNSDLSWPLDTLKISRARREDAERARLQFMASVRELDESTYLTSLRETRIEDRLKAGTLPMTWAPMQVWSDEPNLETMREHADDDRLVINRLVGLFRGAEKSLHLVSPYFVPREVGTMALTGAAQRGVEVVVVTNTLAANDVLAVHSGYARYRGDLLAGGVQVFETKRAPGVKPKLWSPSSRTSLHAKTFVVDGRWVFIGSFNLDPRSAWINSEMGVLIDSPVLAKQMIDGVTERLALVTYQVILRDGHYVWIDRATGLEYTKEPDASWGRRFLARVLRLLPLDAQL